MSPPRAVIRHRTSGLLPRDSPPTMPRARGFVIAAFGMAELPESAAVHAMRSFVKYSRSQSRMRRHSPVRIAMHRTGAHLDGWMSRRIAHFKTAGCSVSLGLVRVIRRSRYPVAPLARFDARRCFSNIKPQSRRPPPTPSPPAPPPPPPPDRAAPRSSACRDASRARS